MTRWAEIILVACAAGVAVAQWLVPSTMEGLLSGLLLGLVILTVFSQRSAQQQTLSSLNEAHAEQLETERRYRALFDACSDAILVYRLEDDGRQGRLVEVNEAACHSLGYSRSQLLTMTAEDIHAPEARRHVQDRARALSEAGILVFETVHITSDRQRRPVEVSARLVEIGGRRLCLTVSHSIAAHKELEGFLRNLTDIDELTGLLNRRGFFTHVERIRRRARRAHSQVLLMYLDVDGLKRVNDEMGHAAGDGLLVAAADALRDAFREEDVVARIGGDEFVALALLGRRDDERLDCQAISVRLEEAVRAKREELGEAYDFSVSCGSVVANADELDEIDELLAQTDQRMYTAKRERRRESACSEAMTETN
ncbi:MAG TPA: sensor domain-containing diguanylate cyclase [Thermoleophilia bacterium]|nr:sensor domain-containing diguanylate cyclase [Thermoleophilia bacterium]